MAKRQCTVTDEMTAIHPCSWKSRNEWEAECLVCKPGTCMHLGFILVSQIENHISFLINIANQ